MLQDSGRHFGVLSHTHHLWCLYSSGMYSMKNIFLHIYPEWGAAVTVTNCNKVSGAPHHTTCIILQILFLIVWINAQLWEDALCVTVCLCNVLWRGSWSADGGCLELALCLSLLECFFETKLFPGEHMLVSNYTVYVSVACVLLWSSVPQDCS